MNATIPTTPAWRAYAAPTGCISGGRTVRTPRSLCGRISSALTGGVSSKPARGARASVAVGALVAAFCVAAALPSAAAAAEPACSPLLARTFGNIQTGKPQSLCDFAGKVVLFVNTASQCGYTPQYDGLEKLYARYRARGLVVAGFPSNDFGGQEPGSNQEIAEFCRTEFGIEFPMFEKSAVSGPSANPLFADLAKRSGQAPRWNFHKYLIDRSGLRVQAFPSDVAPDSPQLLKTIEKLLAEKP